MFNFLWFEYFFIFPLLKSESCKLHGSLICQPCNFQRKLCSARCMSFILSPGESKQVTLSIFVINENREYNVEDGHRNYGKRTNSETN